MKPLLSNFREQLRERLLNLLWAQWDSLGAFGQPVWRRSAAIDPDALLVISATLARHDARLFDEILDWMAVNGDLLNMQRVAGLVKNPGFRGGPVLSAMAEVLARRDSPAKWGRLSRLFRAGAPADEVLFFQADGQPMARFGKADSTFQTHGFMRGPLALREHAQAFDPARPANLWFVLRALVGVNARADILLYLLLNGSGYARAIARQLAVFQKTVQDALSDMARSGLLRVQARGRERIFTLDAERWRPAVSPHGKPPTWTPWPAVFAAFESIWLRVDLLSRMERDELSLAADLHQLLREQAAHLTRAGVSHALEARPVGDHPAAAIRDALRQLDAFFAAHGATTPA